ncbi:DUF4184 family protein [Actinoplanes sp. CA-051413]|uniref:DUF4184 family protein n=1 Tax=Actinoplanes sp. CA-051413 TaxID=3239899 RepID=UPI003D958AEA
MFWLDPLIALVLLVVFQVLLKRPVVALLPQAAAGRVWQYERRATAVAAPLVLGTVGAVRGVRELMAANEMPLTRTTWTGQDMVELAVRQFAVDGVAAVCVVLAVYAVGWQLSRLATGRRGPAGSGPGEDATLPGSC